MLNNYLKKSVILALAFFLFLSLVDYIFKDVVDWKESAIKSVFYAFVVVPIALWIEKKLNKK